MIIAKSPEYMTTNLEMCDQPRVNCYFFTVLFKIIYLYDDVFKNNIFFYI